MGNSAILQKFICIILTILSLFGLSPKIGEVDKTDWKTDYEYVFVPGYMGWGEYDVFNEIFPYWGMAFSSDLTAYLNSKDIACCAASVDPFGSAWDRACELYAQLTGTVVDYGEAHSEKYGHDRYGKDYSNDKLIQGDWCSKNKLNFVGHSFGGNTILMLLKLLNEGSREETAVTGRSKVSKLFTGGKGNWVYSVVTIASPLNGTSLFYGAQSIFSGEQSELKEDSAIYDLHPDSAAAFNKTLTTYKDVYYFTYAFSTTEKTADGTQQPLASTPAAHKVTADMICKVDTVTANGVKLDSKWQSNDGIVNTYSAEAPFNQPQCAFNAKKVNAGVWNKMGVFEGNHGSMCSMNMVDEYLNFMSVIAER